MARNDGRALAVIGSVAWIGLAVPGLFFAFVGFIGIGLGGTGARELALGCFLMLFPVLAVGSVLACWILRSLGRFQAARVAILIPALPALVEVALMIDIGLR